MVEILKQCQRELAKLPVSVREDLADAVARLEEGHVLSMPLCRPMPDVGSGVYELRFKDRTGAYRVFYVLLSQGSVIHLLHAFKKKTGATPLRNIKLVKKRLKEVLKK